MRADEGSSCLELASVQARRGCTSPGLVPAPCAGPASHPSLSHRCAWTSTSPLCKVEVDFSVLMSPSDRRAAGDGDVNVALHAPSAAFLFPVSFPPRPRV